jgi:formylaminopyrimidine deformylase / aminopyrimidine aminohydrolase
MSGSGLLEPHAEDWRAATAHPFLDGVREGTLPPGAFAAWLRHDYQFVGDLLVFQARLLSQAPRPAQAVLAGGLVALEAELTWFEAQAGRRGLDLAEPRHPTTEAYRQELERLLKEPFAAAITGLCFHPSPYGPRKVLIVFMVGIEVRPAGIEPAALRSGVLGNPLQTSRLVFAEYR